MCSSGVEDFYHSLKQSTREFNFQVENVHLELRSTLRLCSYLQYKTLSGVPSGVYISFDRKKSAAYSVILAGKKMETLTSTVPQYTQL